MQSGTQTITECSGKLFDDGGTGDYSSNTDYTTTISPSGASSIDINFLVFDVEAGSGSTCNYDWIKIYDGPSTSSPLIGTYCNTNGSPGTFSTTGGDITIVQHSDQNTEGDGFEMVWQCVYANLPPVAAFTASDTNTCNATINFTDYSTNGATSWLWNFGDGNTSTLPNPTHSYASNGTYTVTLIATNTYGSDTLIKTNYIEISAPTAPTAIDGQRCSAGTVQIAASGVGTIRWFNSLGSSTILDTGATYTTPSITTTTTYYAEDLVPGTSVYGGETYNAGNGNIYTTSSLRYLIFDVTANIILKTVEVTASGTGNRTIELQNSAGTVIDTRTINIPNGTSRIDLDFEIAPGTNYRLVGPSSSPNLFRSNSNLNYPYDISGLVNIKGSNASNSTGYYYYFYDWEISEFCTSGRTAVDAEIMLPANVTITTIGNTNLCPGDTVTLVAPSGATSYHWHPTNETTQSIEVTSNTGNYYVDYTIDSCSLGFR